MRLARPQGCPGPALPSRTSRTGLTGPCSPWFRRYMLLCFCALPLALQPPALAPKPLPQSPCPTPLPQSPCLPYDPLPSNHGPVLTALAWSAFYTPANLVPAFVACLVSKSTCPLAKTPFFTRPLALCGGPFALCCGLWPSVKHGAVVCQDPLIAGSG